MPIDIDEALKKLQVLVINDELYICKIISKNTKNDAIVTAIKGVVPQPGATLPYSAFNGRKISPKRVLKAIFFF